MFGMSCQKNYTGGAVSALNVVNATVGLSPVYVFLTRYDSAFYNQQASVSFGSWAEYGVPAGDAPITVVSSTDTASPLLQGNLVVRGGAIYTLYLAGVFPNIDTLFMRDTIPVYPDSAAGVRFINLSADSKPITINLQGNLPSQTEFPALAYKNITAFKSYPDTNGITSYIFEVRDQATGSLVTTFNWNFTLGKNNTLVICGSEESNSSFPIGVLQVNNY